MDEGYYRSLANELATKVGRLTYFVSHGPSIGVYHEEVLKAVLRPVLSDRYSLRTGFAFDPSKKASQQGDILVVDETHPDAYYFREGNFAVVNPEALACVIEVKTSLDRKRFTEALKALHSFREITSNASHPITFLFAFKAPAFAPQRLSDWYSRANLPDSLLSYPMAIFALNAGLLMLREVPGSGHAHFVVLGDTQQGPKLKCLSVFLQTIRKSVLTHAKHENNPFNTAALNGLSWSKEYLKLGVGAYNSGAV